MSLRKTVLCVSSAVLFSGISLSAAAEVLKMTEVQPEGYPNVVALENMGKKLAAATGGRLTTQMFANGSLLSSEKEMIEQAQVGAVQLVRTSLGVLGPVVPDVNVFNIPFIFRDEAHMRQVIDGPIGDEILQKITDSPAGVVGLGWMDSGTRNLFTKKPIKTPADLKGLKIRMMGNPLFIDTMNAMGGNGISLAHGEVFSALQTGVVDGAENNEPTYFVNNWYTQAKNYTYTGHLIIPEIFVFSKITWDKLSKEDQELLKKFSREVQMEQRALWDEKVAAVREQMVKEGVVVNNEIDKKTFYDLTAPVRAKYGASFADLIKRIEAVK
jgi:tripartite ATP-independent transporter DctP family solute receptor